MTSLDALLAGPVVHRLGWTLLHSLWQVVLVALLLWIVLLLLKRRSASSRYLAGCLSLALMAALPAGTLWLSASQVAPPNAAPANAALPAGTTLSDLPAQWFAATTDPTLPSAGGLAERKVQPWHARLAAWLEPNLRWVVAAWLAGVAVLSLRIVAGWVAAQRLRRRRCAAVPAAWQARFAELAVRIGVSRPVQLLESTLAEVPTVIGHIRPVILLPISALTGLAPQQLEAILAHELAHIRRHDYLVNLVQVVIETLLFYHPATWWVSRRIRIERENCCDDIAVDLCGDRFAYIRALVSLEESRSDAAPRPQLAVAWQGTSLLDRARRLVGTPAPQTAPSARWMAGPLLLAAALAVVAGVLTSALASQGGQGPEGPGTATPAAVSAPASQAGREDADTLLTSKAPHWERYSVGETRKNKDGQEVTQLVVERPTEFGANKGKADKNGRDIMVSLLLIQAPVGADLAAAAKAIGKSQPGRFGTWKLYPGARRPPGNQEVLQDAISPAFLSAEQVQKLAKEAEAKGWTVLTRPTIAMLEWQDAWVEVHTMLTDWPIPEQSSGTVSRFDISSGSGIGVQPRILPSGWIEMDLLVRFAQVSEAEEPARGGGIGVIEGGMRGMASVRNGETMLMRVPTGRASMQCYRKRASGSAKKPAVEVLMEPIEGGEPLGPVYLLITPRIMESDKAVTKTEADSESPEANAGQQPGEVASAAVPATFPADAADRLARFPINGAQPSDVIAAFGKPKAYRDGGRMLDENALPDAYCMDYGNGFMVWVGQGKVQELRLEMQAPPEMADFAYDGRLKLGSSLEDVLAVMGTPDRVQEGGPLHQEDGVLYKDFEGHKGAGYYQRLEKGLRLWIDLDNNKVMALYITRKRSPEPRVPLEEATAFNVDLQAKVAQVRLHSTREEVIQIFGKPIRYFNGDTTYAEGELPGGYMMQYPAGVCVGISEEGVNILSFANLGPVKPNYAYRDQLRVGATVEEVFAVLGQPDRIVEGDVPGAYEDGVLYKNFQGRRGFSTYGRGKPGGIRVWLQNDRVGAMSVWPEPAVR